MKETTLKVPDMSCGHCVATIQGALESLEGVESIEATLDMHIVKIIAIEELSEDDLMEVVQDAGYTPELVG